MESPQAGKDSGGTVDSHYRGTSRIRHRIEPPQAGEDTDGALDSHYRGTSLMRNRIETPQARKNTGGAQAAVGSNGVERIARSALEPCVVPPTRSLGKI